MIETFISARIRGNGIARKTANRQREILHRMFEYAIKKWQFVSRDRRFPNPAAAVERRREPAPGPQSDLQTYRPPNAGSYLTQIFSSEATGNNSCR
jgi:hypothetical protein